MTLRRWLSLGCVALGATLTARQASAQLAPTGGHYASRDTDTGYAGLVNSSGGYSASVPLDLPAARGGLPVPVGIVYTERGFGAAGLGWDVPLSFIRDDTTFAHRRPANTADAAPQFREQVSVTLDGARIDLVQTAATTWIARRDATDLEVRKNSDGTWVMYDGQGRTYRFGTVSPVLAAAKTWLLTDISGPAGSNVHLDYTIGAPTLPAGTGVSIDLASVSYNVSPDSGQGIASCYKNTVVLNYAPDTSTPQSMTTLGSTVLARVHRLATIDVNGRAGCGEVQQLIREYQLSYAEDPDTKQLKLQSVALIGRTNTPENSTPLTIAKYSYGTATSGRQLTYRQASSPALGFTNLGKTELWPNGYQTRSMLIDIDGDGRPDLLTTNTTNGNDTVSASLNTSTVDNVTFGTSKAISGTADFQAPEILVTDTGRYSATNDSVYRMAIDVNGDGRVDIIDAGELKDHWVVYLNTPDGNGIQWRRRSYSIVALRQHLRDRGMSIGDFMPLVQRRTLRQVAANLTCWIFMSADGRWERDAEDDQNCHNGPLVDQLLEMTITEWELKDVNGDGFPDVVFDSSAASIFTTNTPFPANPTDFETFYQAQISDLEPSARSNNNIEVALNVVGANLPNTDVQIFSAPVTLINNDSCGVERWISPGTTFDFQHLLCGFEDVNGDGIVDRVNDRSVALGTGNAGTSGWFTASGIMTLPGRLAIHQNPQSTTCSPGISSFQSTQFAGLRDVTGDGIGDRLAAILDGHASSFVHG